jgi:hypothetical protein
MNLPKYSVFVAWVFLNFFSFSWVFAWTPTGDVEVLTCDNHTYVSILNIEKMTADQQLRWGSRFTNLEGLRQFRAQMICADKGYNELVSDLDSEYLGRIPDYFDFGVNYQAFGFLPFQFVEIPTTLETHRKFSSVVCRGYQEDVLDYLQYDEILAERAKRFQKERAETTRKNSLKKSSSFSDEEMTLLPNTPECRNKSERECCSCSVQ